MAISLAACAAAIISFVVGLSYVDNMAGTISSTAIQKTLGKKYDNLIGSIEMTLSKNSSLLNDIQEAISTNDTDRLSAITQSSVFGNARNRINKVMMENKDKLSKLNSSVKSDITQSENDLLKANQAKNNLTSGSFIGDMTQLNDNIKSASNLTDKVSNRYQSNKKSLQEYELLKGASKS